MNPLIAFPWRQGRQIRTRASWDLRCQWAQTGVRQSIPQNMVPVEIRPVLRAALCPLHPHRMIPPAWDGPSTPFALLFLLRKSSFHCSMAILCRRSRVSSSSHHQAAPPAKVDPAPLEDGLTQLRTQHRDLRDQVVEQNAALKRVEDQLEMVREATDRNTLEQQELLEDLKIFSNKVKVVAVLAIGLLAISFLINLILFFHIQRVLP